MIIIVIYVRFLLYASRQSIHNITVGYFARKARGSAISGTEIDRLSPTDLQSVVRSAAVFYRVTPKHKVRIVKALQVI